MKRKSTEPMSDSSDNSKSKRSPEKAKVRKTIKSTRSSKNSQSTNYSTADSSKKKKAKTSGRAERAKRRGEASPVSSTKSSPVVDQKKARVLAKVAFKTAIAAHQAANKPQPKKSKLNLLIIFIDNQIYILVQWITLDQWVLSKIKV